MTFDEFVQAVRAQYPHGHPAFVPISVNELQLHSDKNHDYAAGGSPLGNFERVASILRLYPKLSVADPRVVALVYALKQLDAVLWGLNQGHVQKVEGLSARLQDISVYAKIVMCMEADKKEIDRQFGVDLHAVAVSAQGVVPVPDLNHSR